MPAPRYASYISHTDTEIKGFFEKQRYLSNYDPSPVWYEGLYYPTTENAYQAAKCYLEADRKRFQGISPADAKALGQIVPMRDDWDEAKFDIMSELVFQKFLKHKDKRTLLLATGDRYLEETNHWHDRTWGVCQGVGKNWLGVILMKTRSFFQEKKIQPEFTKMKESDFLEWVAATRPEPWCNMALNWQMFGSEGATLNALADIFHVKIIP